MKIKLLLVVFFISNCLSTPNIRKISNQPQFRSESHYFSEVITSSNVNGKPESHVRKMKLEEFRNKDNGQPEKVRKFGQIIKKDNDKKAQVIRQASSNVEEEGLILGNGKEKKTLEKNEEKQLLPEADQLFKTKGFKDMFNLDMGFKSFDNFFNDEWDNDFKNSGFNHFFEDRKNNLIHKK